MGVLEVHPWGSRNDDLEHPDRLIFDLDPDESLPWPVLTEAAADSPRSSPQSLASPASSKPPAAKACTSSRLSNPNVTWTEVKDLAHSLVLAMERNNPALYLTKMTKSARKGKIYLDYLRNERGATAVAPYSPRARSASASRSRSHGKTSTCPAPLFQVSTSPIGNRASPPTRGNPC